MVTERDILYICFLFGLSIVFFAASAWGNRRFLTLDILAARASVLYSFNAFKVFIIFHFKYPVLEFIIISIFFLF